MATAEPWTCRIPCRYFHLGICRAGDNCQYSHDPDLKPVQSADHENGATATSPQQVCRFYLRGCCNFGSKCRYTHGNPDAGANKDRRTEVAKNSKDRGNTGHGMNTRKTRSGSPTSKMVVLKKGTKSGSADSTDSGIDMDGPSTSSPPKTKTKKPEDWVKAAEFIPGQPYKSQGIGTYSEVARSGLPEEEMVNGYPMPPEPATEETKKLICPFAAHNECRYGENCIYTHGDICDLCFHAVLHPVDQEQRKKHREECMAEIEKDMEESFAFQRSKEMSCGICMEVVMDKEPPSERRFGILSHCNHCFCLSCIRKWRQAKQFENKVVRACPECRKTSDFVTPSEYWVESQEEKQKLIDGYKKALSEKACKYFDQGRGECPFNERCFYKHAYPDGRIAEPKPRPKRRRQNADGESDLMQSIFLWDFFEEREMLYDLFVNDLLEDLIFPGLYDTDSDDSDVDDDYFSLHL